MLTALRLAFIFWMMCPFLYFMTAGANTFTVPKLRGNGATPGSPWRAFVEAARRSQERR
jgi:hypothetical protein